MKFITKNSEVIMADNNEPTLHDVAVKLLQLNAEYNLSVVLNKLRKEGYISMAGTLTQKGKELLEQNTTPTFRYTEEEMSELVETIRSIYPPGLKPGTNKSWRGTPEEVTKKLYIILKQYPDITKEEVVEAVKRNMHTGESKYRQALPYFIFKFGESKMYEMICAMRDEKSAGMDITDLLNNDTEQQDSNNDGNSSNDSNEWRVML